MDPSEDHPDAKESTDYKPIDDFLIEISVEDGAPATTDANDKKDNSSSDESDDEDAKITSEQQKATQRRRVHNARFEALSVSIFIVPAMAN